MPGEKVLVLGFDLGASSGRGVLGSFDGERLTYEEIHRFPNVPVRLGSGFYWDLFRLWHEIKEGIKKAVATTGGKLTSIGVDTWGVDYVLIDDRGQILTNPYHYRDPRTQALMPEVVAKLGAEYLYERTGIQLLPFNTLFQLAADLQERPEILALTARVLLMPDFFNYLLTGQAAAEYSVASTTGFLNVHSRSWDQEILAKLGFPGEKLPPVISPGTRLGSLSPELCAELQVSPVPVVAVAGHDTASAVAATPLAEGEAFLSSGTWSLMGVESADPIVTPLSRRYNFTNEGGVGERIRFLKNLSGLWLIQECRRLWRQTAPRVDYDLISRLAAEAEPFKALINPADPRFFAPLNMEREIKQYCQETGQEIPEGIGAVARCIYQSLALEYRYTIEQLQKVTGKTLRGLHIVGGGAQDRFLSQLTADALAFPVRTGPTEATVLGNLVVQLMSMGLLKNLREARELIRRSFPAEEYHARVDGGWEEAYRRFLQLVAS